MAFEHILLLGKIELDVISTAQGTLTIQSDIPGHTMADRGSIPVPASTRRNVQKRLPFTFQGHLFQFKYVPGPGGTARLYGVRVWARELPNGAWQWYRLPVVDTPDGYQTYKLDIPGTPEEWSTVKIGIPPTSEEWSTAHVHIPATPDDWQTVDLQFPQTPNDWRDFKLPLKPTPPLPDWVALAVDE